jgi:Ca2+:H+ antiporter
VTVPFLRSALKWAPTVVPAIAVVVLVLAWGRHVDILVAVLIALVLAATILVAVHHAEVIAHKVGEPFGSLILAVAVTVIEVGLIITLSASGGSETATLARDTVFAALMITTTGVVGISILVGSARHGVVRFNAEGAGAALATLCALAVLCLVLPNFTSAAGPKFTSSQLLFAAIASLALYAMFVVTQTISHRESFLPVAPNGAALEDDDHAETPTTRQALVSLGLLIVSLVAVVGLAKLESPSIEAGVAAIGFPQSFVGVVIALLILLPESIAAIRAARRNRLQTSLNLALGSAMASIGLTIPAIAVASIWLSGPLLLGLGSTQIVLLALTVVVSILTVVPGRATKLQGGVHLVLFAAFLFLSISP